MQKGLDSNSTEHWLINSLQRFMENQSVLMQMLDFFLLLKMDFFFNTVCSGYEFPSPSSLSLLLFLFSHGSGSCPLWTLPGVSVSSCALPLIYGKLSLLPYLQAVMSFPFISYFSPSLCT